jgi:hypothetical protein
MFYILMVGILMALASAGFWCLEAMPTVRALKALQPPKQSKNPITVISESLRYVVGFISAISKLWPLGIDILCTIWLSGAFGFSGMIGGIIGLSISNVISVFLIIISKQSPKTDN